MKNRIYFLFLFFALFLTLALNSYAAFPPNGNWASQTVAANKTVNDTITESGNASSTGGGIYMDEISGQDVGNQNLDYPEPVSEGQTFTKKIWLFHPVRRLFMRLLCAAVC